jgi:hypothetical protein
MNPAPIPAALYQLTPAQHAAVWLALGHYSGLLAAMQLAGTPDTRPIVTAHGSVAPIMDSAEIEALRASLNHTGLEFGSAIQLFGTDEEHDAYVVAAKRCVREGELEVDTPTVVSRDNDGDGAYVQAWVWVDDDDARANEIDGYTAKLTEDGVLVKKLINSRSYSVSLADLTATGELESDTGLDKAHKVKRDTIERIEAWAAIVAATCPITDNQEPDHE